MPGYGNQSKRGKLSSAGLVIQLLDLPASYKWFRRVCGPAATQANLGYFENLECDKIDRIRDQGCTVKSCKFGRLPEHPAPSNPTAMIFLPTLDWFLLLPLLELILRIKLGF